MKNKLFFTFIFLGEPRQKAHSQILQKAENHHRWYVLLTLFKIQLPFSLSKQKYCVHIPPSPIANNHWVFHKFPLVLVVYKHQARAYNDQVRGEGEGVMVGWTHSEQVHLVLKERAVGTNQSMRDQ